MKVLKAIINVEINIEDENLNKILDENPETMEGIAWTMAEGFVSEIAKDVHDKMCIKKALIEEV